MRNSVPILIAISLALSASGPPARASQRPPNALDLVRSHQPEIASRLDVATRGVLALVSADEAEALLRGDLRLRDIRLPNGSRLSDFLESVLGAGTYALPFYSMDSGGGESLGGQYRVLGTLGQPDAVVLTNAAAGYTLVGGFRGRLSEFDLFRDGFETGDSTRWSSTLP